MEDDFLFGEYGDFVIIRRNKNGKYRCRCTRCGKFIILMRSTLLQQRSCSCIPEDEKAERNRLRRNEYAKKYRIKTPITTVEFDRFEKQRTRQKMYVKKYQVKIKEKCDKLKIEQETYDSWNSIEKIGPWTDYQVFLKDMGYKPTLLHRLIRFDENGLWCKDNCVWTTSVD